MSSLVSYMPLASFANWPSQVPFLASVRACLVAELCAASLLHSPLHHASLRRVGCLQHTSLLQRASAVQLQLHASLQRFTRASRAFLSESERST